MGVQFGDAAAWAMVFARPVPYFPIMTISAGATRQIIEDVYEEALILADEVRAAFDSRTDPAPHDMEEGVKIALSVEGLRTTTRLMHLLAWLLNQRAYLDGELSDSQLRQHGGLPGERPALPGMTRRLDPHTQDLIRQSVELYRRVERLDRDWRAKADETESPVGAMQGRLERAFAG